MAAKKRRSLISGAPRSGRSGDGPSGDLSGDLSDASETSELPASEAAPAPNEALDAAARMAQSVDLARTDRFPTMQRPPEPEEATEHPTDDVVVASDATAPRPEVGVTPAGAGVTPGGVDRDGWFVRTGQPAPRREPEPVLAAGPSPLAWLAALGLAVVVAVAIAVIVWLVVG